MKERLDELIAKHGLKHWAQAARKDDEFVAWVDEKTADHPEMAFADRVYAAVSGISPVCDRGRRRSLNSIVAGWRFCGRGASCACASESRSAKSKTVWASKSVEQISEIVDRRERTLLERHGVDNPGKLVEAREAHAAFYADPEKTKAAVARGRETMLDRYGVPNALNLPEVNEFRKSFRPTAEQKASGAAKRAAKAKQGNLIAFGYERVSARVKESGSTLLTPLAQYKGTSVLHYYDFECAICALRYRDYVKDGHEPCCPKCRPHEPSFVSRGEDEVAAFVAVHGADMVRNTRKLIAPHELDIVIPERKLAIEYCGLYWHSELGGGRDAQYHRAKLDACESLGYRLITLFEDEWLRRPEIVKARLRHALGVNARIPARATEVRELDPSVSNTFMDAHHIQGAAVGAVAHLGLFHNGELVAAMSLGALRRNNNSRAVRNQYELYRFAAPANVVGGASKLFAAFRRTRDPEMVVSYCDRRWGQGQLYRQMGFALETVTAPGYWWLTDRYQVRHHRFNFTKHKLVEAGYDPQMTEVEIMRKLGHDRIWDCGNYKFVWRKP